MIFISFLVFNCFIENLKVLKTCNVNVVNRSGVCDKISRSKHILVTDFVLLLDIVSYREVAAIKKISSIFLLCA